jgi:riboflavin synthase
MTFAHGFSNLTLGESVALNGACLTLIAFDDEKFDVELSEETLKLTTWGDLSVGEEVNMERALRAGDRLGGHMVTGHVDGIATVVALEPEGEMSRISLDVPADLSRFIARKGSLTVDGVSLTVNSVEKQRVDLLIIPHTRSVTTLGTLALGQRTNIEVDLVARYVDRLLEARGASA